MVSNASEMLLIDRVADEFESQWRRGQRPAIAPYLGRVPAELRAPTLSELVQVDLEYRRKRGDSPSFREYEEQFPDDFHAPDTAELDGAPPEEFYALGRYFVISRLASSGQGETFLAVHPTPATVVLKFLRRDLDPQLQFSIRREARILAQLNHPYIARVTDLDRHEGRTFIAVEYVPGQTLDQYARDRELGQREAAAIVAEIARILAAAHDAGIAHLDIKPRNIVIDIHGKPHVIDFGAAWVSNTLQDDAVDGGFLAGTLAFTSPEQARGDLDSVGARSDIFGLGALLYYLLASKAPFAALDIHTSRQLARCCEYPPLSGGVSGRLRRICAQAMAADPSERQRDTRELATQLDKFGAIPDVRRRVFLAAMVAAAAGIGLLGRSMLAGGQPAAPDPVLELKVVRDDGPVDVLYGGPLKIGDRIKVAAHSPHGTFASAWMIDGAGELIELPHTLAESPDRAITYPPNDMEVRLKDTTGNWTLICLTNHARAIEARDVKLLLDGAPDAALLPGDIVVKMTSTTVQSDRFTSRKPLQLTADEGPDVPARLFLEHLRTRAAAHGYGVQAITFPVSAP